MNTFYIILVWVILYALAVFLLTLNTKAEMRKRVSFEEDMMEHINKIVAGKKAEIAKEEEKKQNAKDDVGCIVVKDVSEDSSEKGIDLSKYDAQGSPEEQPNHKDYDKDRVKNKLKELE